jgi:DNA-directed RNA polymerase subunit RPC12/RpoP
MAAPSESEHRYEVTCPHCGRSFVGALLAGEAARYRGFKCPHCKLFTPYERADELDAMTSRPDRGA